MADAEPDPFEPRAPFEFDRYIDGRLMAEGIQILKASTPDEAISKAINLCELRPGQVAVLVLRAIALPADFSALRAALAQAEQALQNTSCNCGEFCQRSAFCDYPAKNCPRYCARSTLASIKKVLG